MVVYLDEFEVIEEEQFEDGLVNLEMEEINILYWQVCKLEKWFDKVQNGEINWFVIIVVVIVVFFFIGVVFIVI